MSASKTLKSALESLLFTWGEPLPAKMASEALNVTEKEAREAFDELAEEYEQEARGIRIRRIDKSYQFVTVAENAEYIERLCTPVRRRRLSQSALEVLAIIAYKQPVTKGEIEAIRGIRCDRVLEGLKAKELVEVTGRSDGIGRPMLYGTTQAFLRYFDLADIKDLPDIQDIESLIEAPEGAEEAMANQISLEDMADSGLVQPSGQAVAREVTETGEEGDR